MLRSNALTLLLFSLIQCGCVTWSPIGRSGLPRPVQESFGPCTGDGLVAMKFFSDDHLIMTPNAEWISENKGQFLLDLFEPGGMTLLRVDYSAARGLLLKGSNENSLRKVKVMDSMLYFEDHSLHIRVDELGCLLQNRFPQEWSSNLKVGKKNKYLYEDEKRKILLNFEAGVQGFGCAEIAESSFLGMIRLDRKICFKREAGKQSGVLVIENVGRMEWRDADSSAT